jgi:GNAT superfamily N-acetyltransferase
MQVREYIPGDEQEISELFNVVFKRKLDLRLWNWRFVENPCGKGIIRLMFDNQKLVGHYAVTPTPLWVKGKVYRAAFSMTTMTHPDYCGRGIFSQLASEVYGCCKAKGIKFVFGFPNENSYHGFTQKLGWHGFGRVKGWAIEREPAHLPREHEFAYEELRAFDKRVDDLWARARESNNIMVPRTADFINWRYFQQPGGEYTVYGIIDRNSVLQGLLVLKVFIGRDETAGHIIDFLAPDRPDVQQAILRKATEFFAKKGVANITCWIPSGSPIAAQLQAIGFSQKGWPTYSGVKVLDDAFEDISFVTDPCLWSFTMGDSDVF